MRWIASTTCNSGTLAACTASDGLSLSSRTYVYAGIAARCAATVAAGAADSITIFLKLGAANSDPRCRRIGGQEHCSRKQRGNDDSNRFLVHLSLPGGASSHRNGCVAKRVGGAPFSDDRREDRLSLI